MNPARDALYKAAMSLATLVTSGASAEEIAAAYKALPLLDFMLEEVKLRANLVRGH